MATNANLRPDCRPLAGPGTLFAAVSGAGRRSGRPAAGGPFGAVA